MYNLHFLNESLAWLVHLIIILAIWEAVWQFIGLLEAG